MAARIVFALVLAPALAEFAGDDACDMEVSASAVVMLQQKMAVQPEAKALQPITPSPNERMQAALPVRYLHIPKTGAGFFNAIFALPGVCDIADGDEPPTLEGLTSAGENFLPLLESCPGFVYDPWAPHGCLQSRLPDASGHFMGMFRQPEQRLLSLYDYASGETERMPASPFAFPPDDVRVFFERARGGMVYQLTHEDDGSEGFCTGHLPEDRSVTDADVEEAIRVIQEDYVFVGITEQWDLSICLLHEMFGGSCNLGEFENVHPGLDPETGEARDPDSERDVSVLEGAIDTHDRALYDAALRIFERNLEEFGVTAESCEQSCWAPAAAAP